MRATKEQQKKLKEYKGKEITFGVRPEDLTAESGKKNKIKVVVDVVEPLGSEILLYVSTVDGAQLVARVDVHLEFKVGDEIELGLAIEKCHFFGHEKERHGVIDGTRSKCII